MCTMLVPLVLAVLTCSVVAQKEHPDFDPPMEQVVLEEGSLAKVECVAEGESPLTYKWYNQIEVEITSDANQDVFTRRNENGCSLIFDEVKRSHAGLYSCSASNKHGTASKPYDIIVNSTSGNITTNETATIDSVKVINVTESSVEFFVRTTGDPDTFYIRYREKLDTKEKSVEISRGQKAIVKDLVPSGRYEFRFQIEPPWRIEVPSTPYSVVLLPGVPDVIFRKIQDGFVDLEWFRSTDDFFRSTIEEYELTYNRLQQVGGRSWEASDCVITVKIPRGYCSPSNYIIAGLSQQSYYEIRLRLRTASGYGKPYRNKVRMP